MYAVIRTGGKQYKVAEGDVLTVERVLAADELSFVPLMLVDGDTVLSRPSELAGAVVTARTVDDVRGEKIRILKFKNKSRYQRHAGHRQELTVIEITGISGPEHKPRRQAARKAAPKAQEQPGEPGGSEQPDASEQPERA